MTRPELGDTLLALLDGVQTAGGGGVTVEEAELDVPLEVVGAVEGGRLVFRAGPPFSRWVSGVLPAVHRTRLRIVRADELEGGRD